MTTTTMRALRVTGYGGAEVLRLDEIPLPAPGPGTALVRVEAAGVNFIDIYQRSGAYKGELPFTLGAEGAGTVEAVGDGVGEVRPGQRVGWAMDLGAFASHAVLPARRLVPLPDGVDSQTAAGALLQGMTAHYLASSTYPLQSGEWCLVHAAAGGVGLLLCQIAAMRGARVIGTVSTDEKARLAREAGAEHVILYTRQDFVPEVRRLTEGRGVPVVYDSVGKDTFDRSLDCLHPRGMLVLFGQSSGPVPPVDPQVLNAKGSLYLTRPSLGAYTATREELLQRSGEVLGWIADGRLKLRIDEVYPLDRVPQAHEDLASRRTTGKLIIDTTR